MTLFLVGLGLILVGGMSAALFHSLRRALNDALYLTLVIAGCITSLVAVAGVLRSGTSVSLVLPAALPGGDLVLGLDALSAVFLLAILAVGAACAGYGTQDLARAERGSRFLPLGFTVLLVAIALVIAARSTIVFMGAWEIMAISSYLLIVTHHEEAEVRRAGLVYLVATHTATLALFAMFATWQASAADWSFAALADAAPALDSGRVTALLLLAVIGFGFKAGFVPMHFWLPPAHAAAPTQVSALMSGVVIKTGIYGLLRVVMLLGGAPAWYGWLLLVLGIASSILGVLWALAQHDTKRLLAYHSVENIGIILMGIGIGVLGLAHNAPAIAMLGFVAALLHTINHALFKSLLFLGAGAVYRATGTRDLEELGGVARRMPITWLTFAVGAAAIVGLPPFNGFVSEWLVYQGLFLTGQTGDALRLTLIGIPALALTGALALACFTKVAGVVFLGTPRTAQAAAATEAGRGARVPMLFLAIVCIALGVVPMLGVSVTVGAAAALAGAPGAALPTSVVSGAAAISLLAAVMAILTVALWTMRALLTRNRVIRQEVTWACGYAAVSPRMQYTASSFAAPVLSFFGRLSGSRLESSDRSLHTHTSDLVLDGMALPLWRSLHRAALRLRPIQHGRLHLYLLYVLAALLVMLGYLAFAVR